MSSQCLLLLKMKIHLMNSIVFLINLEKLILKDLIQNYGIILILQMIEQIIFEKDIIIELMVFFSKANNMVIN